MVTIGAFMTTTTAPTSMADLQQAGAILLYTITPGNEFVYLRLSDNSTWHVKRGPRRCWVFIDRNTEED